MYHRVSLAKLELDFPEPPAQSGIRWFPFSARGSGWSLLQLLFISSFGSFSFWATCGSDSGRRGKARRGWETEEHSGSSSRGPPFPCGLVCPFSPSLPAHLAFPVACPADFWPAPNEATVVYKLFSQLLKLPVVKSS